MTIWRRIAFTLTFGFLVGVGLVAVAVAGLARSRGFDALASDAQILLVVDAVLFVVVLILRMECGTRAYCESCRQRLQAHLMTETELGECCVFCANRQAVAPLKGAA